MNTLENYGWNKHFQQYYNQHENKSFESGRVQSIKGQKYLLITESGELEAELSGKLLFGSEPELLPKVGDWVLFLRYDTVGYVMELIPRINALSRKSPGSFAEKQVMAANIDYALVVQGLDRDFNIMRLDRYIVQVLACGIKPVVILNKADLVDDIESVQHEVERLGRDCPVYFISTYNESSIDMLKESLFLPGKTYILIGSSGVGKSSLLNALLDHQQRETGEISDSTGKGKHVTTTRDLFQLPNGSLVIDSPGMREFGIAFDTDPQHSGLFPLIDAYAEHCRYSDCKHMEENGCAVIEAYNSGALDEKVYQSYLKLLKEQKHFEIRKEDKKRLGKQFGKMVREVKDFKLKNSM